MKNFTTCICIMGLSGVAAADIMWDQIGEYDGSGIGANIMACQDFEAGFDAYDVVVADNFTGDGSSIDMLEMVIGGWNGFVDPSGVTGYTANLYSSDAQTGVSLVGDIDSNYVDAANVTIDANWTGANFLLVLDPGVTSVAGEQLIGLIPANEYATNGQTGCADSAASDGTNAIQGNPGGGFGFGTWQAIVDADGTTPVDGAYRIGGYMAGDPCDDALPTLCAADVDMDGSVAVSDVLAIIGQWGDCGDGTFRPSGDVAPMPNGDCCVTVADVLAVVGSWGADCTVYGSCCYADETCADTSEADCTAGAGSWNGDGSDCASTSCEISNTDGDECSTALPAMAGANPFDTTNMTPSGDEPPDDLCAGTFLEWGGSQDVWFMYVSDGGMTTFDTCDAASYDTSLALYEGTCDNLVACNGDSANQTGCQTYYSEITNFDCVAGETYYLRIGSWQGTSVGTGTLNISPPSTGYGACCFADETCIDVDAADCDAFGGMFMGDGTDCSTGLCEAGPGDECDSAVDAFDGANSFDTTFMTASTPAPDDSMCPGEALDWMDSPDMWMQWDASSTGLATFTTCDNTSSMDTSIVLYEGTCDNQIACNGDTADGADGAGGACQPWYSQIDDVPVTAGETYYIRIGGWQGEVGAGTLTISTGADVSAACCFMDGSCADMTAADCSAAGGSYDGSGSCADVACPQPFACPVGADQEPDACGITDDTNCGMNCDPPMFGDIALGQPVCGTAAIDAAAATRDTDWYYNADLNAGGDFTLSAATSGSTAGLAFGIVDNVALAFVEVAVTVNEGSITFSIAAGDYSVFVAQNAFDTPDSDCGSGAEEYWVMLEASVPTYGACCMPDETCVDVTAGECAGFGGSFDGSQDCSTADCSATGECPAGMAPDCVGTCFAEGVYDAWTGDGFCDDGAYVPADYGWDGPAGVPIYLNCDEFNNDGGDCD